VSMSRDGAFYEYLQNRYKGKIYKIERSTAPEYNKLIVRVEFHIPADETDEIGMYKRIISVIDVIAEGGDGGKPK
jgi:hypothetical protein